MIAISESQRRDLVSRFHVIPAAKTVVVPLGLELDRLLEMTADQPSLRPELGLAPDDLVIGYVGRLVPIKDLPLLVQAFSLVTADDDRVHLLIAGDGPARAELTALCRTLGISARCHLIGWCDDLARLYTTCDLVALTSITEGTPVALIEAMAAGLPIVALRVGGVPDVIEDGVTGLLVSDRDPAVFARALRTLIADSPARRKFAEQARERARDRFSIPASFPILIISIATISTGPRAVLNSSDRSQKTSRLRSVCPRIRVTMGPQYGGLANLRGRLRVGDAVSGSLTPVMKLIARRLGAVARPSPDRWHNRPIPLLGGIAIQLGFLAAVLLFVPVNAKVAWALLAGSVMAGVGGTDDFVHLRPSAKLMAQVLACAVTFGLGQTQWLGWPATDALISILWFVTITNAFNLLDNMDGLCAGVSAIAALASRRVLRSSSRRLLPSPPPCRRGLRVLVLQFSAASIFMGDSGSLFIGATLAVVTLAVRHHQTMGMLSTLMFPVVLLLIPLFDTMFVTLSRKLSERRAS